MTKLKKKKLNSLPPAANVKFDPGVIPSLPLIHLAEVEPSTGSARHLECAKCLGDDGFPRLVQMQWLRKQPGSPSCKMVCLAALCKQKTQRPDGTSGACRGSREMCCLCWKLSPEAQLAGKHLKMQRTSLPNNKKKSTLKDKGWGKGTFLTNVPVAVSKPNTDPSLFRTGGHSKCLNASWDR